MIMIRSLKPCITVRLPLSLRILAEWTQTVAEEVRISNRVTKD